MERKTPNSTSVVSVSCRSHRNPRWGFGGFVLATRLLEDELVMVGYIRNNHLN
jgi:hypothetical protein